MIALFQEIASGIRHLDVRMGTLEKRLDRIDYDVLRAALADVRVEEEDNVDPLTESNPTHDIPPVALRCDGRVLLSTADLDGVDLSSRERWEGIVLNEAEACDVLDRLGFEEASAKTAARIVVLDKKAKKKDRDEE